MKQKSDRKSQKKSKPGMLPGLLIGMLLGGVCGFAMVAGLPDIPLLDASPLLGIAALVLALYAAMLVQIVLHEAGHLVGGLLTGYTFCSFRVFGLVLIKENGRLRLRRMQLAGTAGQCLMAPPDMVDGRLPVMLYNLGGPLANLIAGLAALGLAFAASAPTAAVLLRTFALVGLAFALLNGLPLLVFPVDNYGRNALSLQKDAAALRAFWAQMKVAEATARGLRLRDMPAEWLALPADADRRNPLIVTIDVFACNRLLDEGRFAEADGAMQRLLAAGTGMPELYRALLRRDRALLEMLGDADPDRLSRLYTAADARLLAGMKTYPAVLRTDYAYALLVEKDAAKAQKLHAAFEKATARHPYAGEVAGERELMALIAEKKPALQ